eukprot:6183336-Pleurochrysis_carterae.AAC.1
MSQISGNLVSLPATHPHADAARMRMQRAYGCGTYGCGAHAQKCAAHMLVRRACSGLCGAHAGAARMRKSDRRACAGCGAHA